MSKQNIYDNEIFFAGYKAIRDSESNANTLFEIPTLLSLLPDLKDKTVLDLGCGFGEHCRYFADNGAGRVVGIDLSEKMLAIAQKKAGGPQISYFRMAMEDMDQLTEKFDVVVSSLAFHYVQDYAGLVRKIYELLRPEGTLLFSQEHPLASCHSGGERWTRDENGSRLYANLANYGVEGERRLTWFVDGVIKYHRTFSTLLNTLIETGFRIEKLVEPVPSDELLQKYPEYGNLFHKPDFLLIKARKSAVQPC